MAIKIEPAASIVPATASAVSSAAAEAAKKIAEKRARLEKFKKLQEKKRNFQAEQQKRKVVGDPAVDSAAKAAALISKKVVSGV